MLRRKLIAGSAALALWPADAVAQPAGSWGTGWLEAETRQLLDLFGASRAEFTVRETEGGYVIRFPVLTLDPPGVAFELSEFTITLLPQGDDRIAFEVAASAPSLTIFDDGGRSAVRSGFAGLDMTGVWSARFREPLSVDATLDGFDLAVPEDGLDVSLETVRMRQHMVQSGGGRWTAEQVLEIGNIDVWHRGRREVSIEAASVLIEMTDYDVEAVAAFRERYDIGLVPFPTDRDFYADPSTAVAFLTDLIEASVGVVEDVRYTVALRNMVTSTATGEVPVFGSAELAIGYEDINSDAAAVSVELQLDRLPAAELWQAPPVPRALEGYVPNEIRLAVAIEQLPVDSMLRTVVTSLRGVPDPLVAGTIVGPQLVLLLLRQDITFRLRDLTIEAPDGAARGTAVVQLDPLSALGTTARADFTLVGLDQLIDGLGRMGLENGGIAALTLLQAMGRSGVAEDGRSVRHYTFEQTAAGDIRLNGVDLWPLLPAGNFE